MPRSIHASLLLSLPVIGLLSIAEPGRAATYIYAPDEALYDQATHVAEVVVLQSMSAPPAAAPATDYFAVVGRVLKGSMRSADIVFRLPGGVAADGLELHVPGVPSFRDGEAALLFLQENADGTFGVLHRALGAFRPVEAAGRTFALRDLADAGLLWGRAAPSEGGIRDYEAFVAWLGDRGAGIQRRADYFVQPPEEGLRPAFHLARHRGKPVRWTEFDDGGQVEWRVRSTGSFGSSSLLRAAADAWNRESRTPVKLVVVGATGSTAGLSRSDGVNALIYGDPNRSIPGKFSCTTGGILAEAGFLTRGEISRFEGRDHFRIVEADIVINDGAACLANRPQLIAELFTILLGLTLGIDQSCGQTTQCTPAEREATMWGIHDDGRSASIRNDDALALRALYEGSGAPPPPGPPPGPPPPSSVELNQPTNLVGSALSKNKVQLDWEDNSTGEGAYEVWIKIGRKSWELRLTLPADSTSVRVKELTPGGKYKFKVRATSGASVSEYSDSVKVVMPGGGPPAAPSNLQATATSATEVELSWRDNSNNERKFNLQIREGDGAWVGLETLSANSTSATFSDATPGATYSFRVRARRGKKVSDFSNVATVTMPQ